MTPDSRVYVAGHTGLAGSALERALRARGYSNVITRTSAELDLTNSHATAFFFQREKPEIVFLAAAKVGGILANNNHPAEFISQNLAIQANVIHEAWRAGVRRLVFLSSSCIYPRDCAQPIREDYLLTGPLEVTNRAFAVAKIAGIEMCWAYNRQYGTRYFCAMSTNLYGLNDTYDLEGGHVLPAMMRRFHEAKQRGDKKVVMWGTGAPLREFLDSDDLADACLHLMLHYSDDMHINVGTGVDLSIRELAEKIRDVVYPAAELHFDTTKPDGTPRKVLDVSRLAGTGWTAGIDLDAGLASTYQWFLDQHGANIRGLSA